MTRLEDLFDLAERGCVIVFPTEESARGFAVQYVARRRKGLKASSAIAFDTFASSFFPRVSALEPASEIDRIIFSNYAAATLSSRFRYFTSSSYPEVKERLAPYIRSMLPNLADAMRMRKRSRAAESDLRLIEHEYKAFLARSGLYEPSFEDITVPELASEYVLVMPSAFPKEERIAAALHDNPRVHFIDDADSSGLTIMKFCSEKEEIRALFCRIRELLDAGVPYSDIVISTAAADRLRVHLEEESYLFSIPLSFTSGRSVLASSAGAFLQSLSDIYSSSYSLDSLKSFFLNPAIPFKDHDGLLKFIEAAISASISSAPSFGKDRYMKIPSADGGDWYRSLRFTLDKLMTESDGEKTLQHLHALMGALLVPEQFNGNDGAAAVFSFAMRELGLFLAGVKRAEKAGYHINKPLFPLFISYLENGRYVPKKKDEGIRVYPFTEDAALSARYRFIIALNDAECTVRIRKAGFLSDYEIADDRSDEDITSNILGAYSMFSDKLYLSAASETYSGYALPLSSLKTADFSSGSDSWRAEQWHLASSRIYPLQQAGYAQAVISSLRTVGRDDDFTYGKKGKAVPGMLSLSFSAFDSYTHCPFVYALKYAFALDRIPSYMPATLDTAEMGTRLHRVLERYYKGEGCDPDSDIPRLFDEEMDGWMRGEGLLPFAPRATDLIAANIRAVYLDNLVTICRAMDGMSKPFDDGLELWVSGDAEDAGFSLKGKIDRLALSSDGSSFIIFDYKSRNHYEKSEMERQSFQMYIYRILVEKKVGKTVSHAYFATLRDGMMCEAPAALSNEEVLSVLKEAAEGIAAGDWHALPSDENCGGCGYRAICRRRFAVR